MFGEGERFGKDECSFDLLLVDPENKNRILWTDVVSGEFEVEVMSKQYSAATKLRRRSRGATELLKKRRGSRSGLESRSVEQPLP